MDVREYVVVRFPRELAYGGFELNSKSAVPGSQVTRAVPGVTVETLELDDHDARALREAPKVAVAPVIDFALHEPFSDESTPGDENDVWGIRAVGADSSPYTGAGITVAVLDTGIDRNHEAFEDIDVVEMDFTDEGNGDKNGHGTHCAGSLFGKPVDGKRLGVAPGVQRALIAKVLDFRGKGSTANILAGIEWALKEGANVISMSLGMDFPGYVERLRDQGIPARAATSLGLEAYRANVELFDSFGDFIRKRTTDFQSTIIVAATGNESDRPNFAVAASPPAAAASFISVGALGMTPTGLEVARFSNKGAFVSAPGVKIISARVGGGLRTLSGTSMATPHVAGVAALWAEHLIKTTGKFNPVMLTGKLIGSAVHKPLVAGFDSVDVGAGLVQAPRE